MAWAMRKLKEINPTKHIDIASYIYFVALASAYIPIEFYEYRTADIKLSGLTPLQADLLKLPFENNSIMSLSCMHVIEHIGLGRYGDKIDYDGDLKAISEIKRVLAPGGSLLFVVPIGKPKLMFNAHRIYSYDQIIEYFDGFELKEFSLIPDGGSKVGLITNALIDIADKQNYGCGCFHLYKKGYNNV
jgi:SAM-dependent methyltransferase